MRERLIELLKGNLPHFTNDVASWNDEHIGELADHLLANGVVVPPVKVGDTVWMVDKVWCLDDRKTWTSHYEKKVLKFKVRSISMSCNSKGDWTKKFRICEVKNGKATNHQHDIGFEDFGKTVFLTREDAERVLKGKKE